jgi:diaminohydroxyphosphoribosylaminopyrimidine deaminase/5-amino-6-(5-phosphoribosylamino)uracil reductase
MTEQADLDRAHLARSIALAARGEGLVAPNPLVGAVVARGAEVLGEGWHERLGGAYVSLEPCCHTGRTPPCTEAIIAAGLRRVVVASDDPSEKACGRGLGILRDEGIEVLIDEGELSQQARSLNQPFRKHARVGRPWILFKSAMTLDGKVATRTGDSRWISGVESRDRVHRWRSMLSAVIVGIGTVLADDPLLTARPNGRGAPEATQPRRVVFDSLARTPLDSRLVRHTEEAPLTIVVSRAARRADTDALEAAGAEVIVASGENEPARVRNALDQLGALGITSALLEGGPHLAGAFLDSGEIDEVRLFVAPMLLGGRTARDPLEGEGVDRIADAMRTLTLDCDQVGDDLMISARLHEW